MTDTLDLHLKRRAAHALRDFKRSIEGLTEEEARRDGRPSWPGQKWGLGQDGSIAGIVYHVAAWKSLSLPLLKGEPAPPMEQFDSARVAGHNDWTGIVAWFLEIADEWNAAVASLPEEAFDEQRELEGQTMTLAALVTEIYEHDLQHAAQIDYLRQAHIADDA